MPTYTYRPSLLPSDPSVPADGTQNITGDLVVSGSITGDSLVALHATTHQNGGTDEISVSGLSGQLADTQLSRFYIGPFAASNIAASSTDSAAVLCFAYAAGSTHRSFMPVRAMSILGMSFNIDTLASNVGTCTVQIFVDGVDSGTDYDLVFDPSASSASSQAKIYATPLAIAAPTLNVQSTTSRIDLRVTTTADWSATTSDVVVFLECLG
jgi:hypothetical protein